MRSALGRLTPVGLRWRLAAWVAAVVLVCTGITFVAVYRGTGAQLRNQIDREVAGEHFHVDNVIVAATCGCCWRAMPPTSRTT